MVHLHLHTKYSLLDSTIQLDDLITKLDELGMDTVAITDHGNMYGCCELYKMLKQHGKKLIIGCESARAFDQEAVSNYYARRHQNRLLLLHL